LQQSRGIIFVQYRQIANLIHQKLIKEKIRAGLLVGQKLGLKRQQQTAVIRSLANGINKVLIATSVGQQRLDIPNLDFVIIYSPTYDPRRAIQRIGRTGRTRKHILLNVQRFI